MEQVIDKKRVNSEIFKLILPAVLENVLQLLAGVVVTIMVGRLTADDMSAQGISNRIYHTLYSFYRGIAVGATVITALHFGAQNFGRCRRVIEQAYLTGVPSSMVFVILSVLLAPYILGVFTDDAAILSLAVQYIRIAVWAIPFVTIIAFNTAAFNGQGDTRTPMFIAIALNIVNITVGYAFIFGLGSIPGLGIVGAAISTLVSQAVGAGLGLVLLYRKGALLSRCPHGEKFFSLDSVELKSLYSAGIPAAFEQVCWQFSAMVMSKVLLGTYGSSVYAAYMQGLQAEMLTEMPAVGFVTAATTLSAKAIGRRDGNLLRMYYKQIMKMAGVVSVFASALLFFFPLQIMQILTDKVDLQQIGGLYIFLMGFAQVPQILSKVYNGVMRSSGSSKAPMYIAFAGIWGIRVPLVILIGLVLKQDIIFIWLAIALDQISRMVMSIIYMKKKDTLHYVERMVATEATMRPPEAV